MTHLDHHQVYSTGFYSEVTPLQIFPPHCVCVCVCAQVCLNLFINRLVYLTGLQLINVIFSNVEMWTFV